MHTPIYRHVIKDAWNLAWHNKTLWLFGFFAGILINGGVYDLGLKMFSRVTTTSITWDSISRNITPPFAFVSDFTSIAAPIDRFNLMSIWVVLVLISMFALGLFLVWLSVVSQGTLIAGIPMVQKKKKDAIRKAFQTGLEKFWSLLGINVALKVTIALIVLFTSFPLVLLIGQSVLLNAILYLLSFLIFIPLAIIVYFIALLASCYIVLRDKPFGRSIHLAWELFKRNWLICLELGFLLFVIGFLVGLAVLLLFLLASIPIVLLLLAALALGSQIASLIVIILAIMVLVTLVVLSGAFVVCFQYTAWVMLFERLTKKGATSRLVRWMRGLDSLHGKPKKKAKAKVKKSKPKKRVVKRKK
jgi:hypothetical protein